MGVIPERLTTQGRGSLPVAVSCCVPAQRRGGRHRRMIDSVMTEARQLPAQEHLTVQRVKEGSVDLTGARLFLTKADMRTKLIAHLQVAGGERTAAYRTGRLSYFVVIRLMLQALSHIHSLWSHRALLTPAQITEHRAAVDQFRHAWEGLGWKPTVWVHWTCAHACFFVGTYRTLFAFSSIPTEHRHQRFKQDLRNTCSAYKFQDPLRCKGFLKRCIELDALDQGLRLRKLRKLDSQVYIFPETNPGVKEKLH